MSFDSSGDYEVVSAEQHRQMFPELYNNQSSLALPSPIFAPVRGESIIIEKLKNNRLFIAAAVGLVVVMSVLNNKDLMEHSEKTAAVSGVTAGTNPEDFLPETEREAWAPRATECDMPVVHGHTDKVVTPISWDGFTGKDGASANPLDFPAVVKGDFTYSACIQDVKAGVVFDEQASEASNNIVWQIDPEKIEFKRNFEALELSVAIPSFEQLRKGVIKANPELDPEKDKQEIEFKAITVQTLLKEAQQPAANNALYSFVTILATDHADEIVNPGIEDVQRDLEQQIVDDGRDLKDYIITVKEGAPSLVIEKPADEDLEGPFEFLSDQTKGFVDINSLINTED